MCKTVGHAKICLDYYLLKKKVQLTVNQLFVSAFYTGDINWDRFLSVLERGSLSLPVLGLSHATTYRGVMGKDSLISQFTSEDRIEGKLLCKLSGLVPVSSSKLPDHCLPCSLQLPLLSSSQASTAQTPGITYPKLPVTRWSGPSLLMMLYATKSEWANALS